MFLFVSICTATGKRRTIDIRFTPPIVAVVSRKVKDGSFRLTKKFLQPSHLGKLLYDLRWPKGFCCPREDCGGQEALEIRERKGFAYYRCVECRLESSIISRTYMHGTHLSASAWVQAVWKIVESREIVPAHLGSKQMSVRWQTLDKFSNRMKKALVPVAPTIFSDRVLIHLMNIFPETTNEIPHFLLAKWPMRRSGNQIQLNQIRATIGTNANKLIAESLRESIPWDVMCMVSNKATFDFLKRLGIRTTIMHADATLADVGLSVDNWCAILTEKIRPKNSEKQELLNQTKLNFAAVAFFENTANMSNEEVFRELLRRMLSVDTDLFSAL